MIKSVLLASIVALGACNDNVGVVSSGTQSLKISLVSPDSTGDINTRLKGSPAPKVIINVQALDVDGNLDPTFDRDVYAYAQFLGTLTPDLTSPDPLATFHVTAGQSEDQLIQLPVVFGPTTVWIDDGRDPEPTYATGTTPTLWYEDPTISDIQKPADELALDALVAAPLDSKNVQVKRSRYGARGRLVINSVFAQGYTVVDVQCADEMGTPPCTAGDYDAIEVFTFSAPLDDHNQFISEGEFITGFAGGISEFNGLTEVGFPQSFVDGPIDGDKAREPAPRVFDPSWFLAASDVGHGVSNFERAEAMAIEIDNAKVCDLDDDFDTFNQWKIDPAGVGGDCSHNHSVLNVVTAGVVADLDPHTLVGKTLTKIVGVLRPLNFGGSGNIWIIYPRSIADITQQ